MRRINHCLNGKLVTICQQSLQLEALNTKLKAYLPEALQSHCFVGSFNKGCLVLIINDPVWGSLLRYCLPELRDKLRSAAGLYQLVSIKVHVAMSEYVDSTKQKDTQVISDKARSAIMQDAEQFSYLPLKEALLHLAGINGKINSGSK